MSRCAITAETAPRLGKYFGTSAKFWLNLQTHYDLNLAEDRALDQIEAIMPLEVACWTGVQVELPRRSLEPTPPCSQSLMRQSLSSVTSNGCLDTALY